jgi:O-antigen/teichoic acid export membrane protein
VSASAAPASAATTPSDQRVILGNTGQNVLGLVIGAVATMGANVLLARRLGQQPFGVVTATTQFAFIAAAATRFGMDVANVRLVAILVGRGQAERARGLVRRSVLVTAAVSLPIGAIVVLLAGPLARSFSPAPEIAEPAFRAAGLTIPLAALAFTYMGATRGLKIMRYTLYSQWIAQPIGWIVLTVLLWIALSQTAGMASLAFTLSWGAAALIAWWGWEKEQHRFPAIDAASAGAGGIREEHTGALLRFGMLRAPATLFSQLIFWTDFFALGVLMRPLGDAGAEQVGIYAGVLRAGQALFLFLTSVSLTFSPFVADLHHRGEHEQLDTLYKQVTRWTLAATVPVLLVLAVLPGPVLHLFDGAGPDGEAALRILIVGMIVPVMVGTVGFILIMGGRTGWDLLIYVASFGVDLGIAFTLARPEALGLRGAAIAQACTLTFSAVARLLLVRRFLRIWPFDRWFLRLIAPTAIGVAVMWGTAQLMPDRRWLVELVVAGAVGTGAYVLAVLGIGIKPNERATALRMAGKVLGRRPSAR